MVCVFISAPLRVFSLSLTALQQREATMHRVEEVVGMEPHFPVPKLQVKTVCDRYLLGMVGPDRSRPAGDCKRCVMEERGIDLVPIPCWKTVLMGSGVPFGMEDSQTFVMLDWTTGRGAERTENALEDRKER